MKRTNCVIRFGNYSLRLRRIVCWERRVIVFFGVLHTFKSNKHGVTVHRWISSVRIVASSRSCALSTAFILSFRSAIYRKWRISQCATSPAQVPFWRRCATTRAVVTSTRLSRLTGILVWVTPKPFLFNGGAYRQQHTSVSLLLLNFFKIPFSNF